MSDLNEAPISLSTKVRSPKGFEYILTLREGADEKIFGELMTFIDKKEQVLLDKGWKALEQNAPRFQKKELKYIQGEVCPLDSGRLIEPEAGTNRPIKCENSKWNAQTKQPYGCAFIKWPNTTVNVQAIPEKQVSAEDYGDY